MLSLKKSILFSLLLCVGSAQLSVAAEKGGDVANTSSESVGTPSVIDSGVSSWISGFYNTPLKKFAIGVFIGAVGYSIWAFRNEKPSLWALTYGNTRRVVDSLIYDSEKDIKNYINNFEKSLCSFLSNEMASGSAIKRKWLCGSQINKDAENIKYQLLNAIKNDKLYTRNGKVTDFVAIDCCVSESGGNLSISADFMKKLETALKDEKKLLKNWVDHLSRNLDKSKKSLHKIAKENLGTALNTVSGYDSADEGSSERISVSKLILATNVSDLSTYIDGIDRVDWGKIKTAFVNQFTEEDGQKNTAGLLCEVFRSYGRVKAFLRIIKNWDSVGGLYSAKKPAVGAVEEKTASASATDGAGAHAGAGAA